MLAAALAQWPEFAVHQIHGGQKQSERRVAELMFAEGTVRRPQIKYAMIAQPASGGVALDMSAASDVFRLSNDYSLKNWEQSNDRPLGQAQLARAVNCTDIVATGPEGQRTMDHIVLEALREKRNIAQMSTKAWRRALEEE